jgi:hypothetical protein
VATNGRPHPDTVLRPPRDSRRHDPASDGDAPLPTSQQTIGPFFPRTFFQPGDNDNHRHSRRAPTRRERRRAARPLPAEGLACLNQIPGG